jgi:hypothetical protein
MMKTRVMTTFLALGVAAGSLGLTRPAHALELNLVQSGEDPPPNWTSLGWKAEGRAGAPATSQTDYEFAIGPNGAQADLTGQIYRTWVNGETVNWSLNWNGQTASLTVDNEGPVTFSLPSISALDFNAFSLFANIIGAPGYVDQGTKIDLTVQTVNGQPVTDQNGANILTSTTATAVNSSLPDFSETEFLTSPEAITSLTGTTTLSWTGLDPQNQNARSRVDWQLVGFNTNSTPVPTSVPESTPLGGLLLFGALGVGSMLKLKPS